MRTDRRDEANYTQKSMLILGLTVDLVSSFSFFENTVEAAYYDHFGTRAF